MKEVTYHRCPGGELEPEQSPALPVHLIRAGGHRPDPFIPCMPHKEYRVVSFMHEHRQASTRLSQVTCKFCLEKEKP